MAATARAEAASTLATVWGFLRMADSSPSLEAIVGPGRPGGMALAE
jgi:hypothetical protein